MWLKLKLRSFGGEVDDAAEMRLAAGLHTPYTPSLLESDPFVKGWKL